MYKLLGDYHTHTIYSSGLRNKGTHAIGTIEENAKAALKIGLKTLVISEHGPRHYLYGLRKERVRLLRDEIDRLNETFRPKGLKILLGIEANLISLDGELDVDHEFVKHLDILLMGYHFGVIPRGLKDFYGLYMINPLSRLIRTFEEKAMDMNTKAYLKAMGNYKIDIITHPGSKAKLHIEEIAKKAYEVGTALEISSKHGELSTKNLKLLRDMDVNFYVNSDAHRPEDIGNIQAGIDKALDAQIPLNRIINIKEI